MSPQVSKTPAGETSSSVPFWRARSIDVGVGLDVVHEADAGHVHELGHAEHLHAGQVAHQQGLVGGLVEQVADAVAGVDPGDLGAAGPAGRDDAGADVLGQILEFHLRPREQGFEFLDHRLDLAGAVGLRFLAAAEAREVGGRFERRGDVHVLHEDVVGEVQRHGREADEALDARAHERVGGLLGGLRRAR